MNRLKEKNSLHLLMNIKQHLLKILTASYIVRTICTLLQNGLKCIWLKMHLRAESIDSAFGKLQL